MEEKNIKRKGSDPIYIIFIVLILMLVFQYIFNMAYSSIRFERSTSELIYCEVVDKYREQQSDIRFGDYYSYYLTVAGEITGGEKFEYVMNVSADRYEVIHIGDFVCCKVRYDIKGIIDARIVDSEKKIE